MNTNTDENIDNFSKQYISPNIYAAVISTMVNNTTMIIYTILIQLFSYLLSSNTNFSIIDFVNPVLATALSICVYQLVFKKILDYLKIKFNLEKMELETNELFSNI